MYRHPVKWCNIHSETPKVTRWPFPDKIRYNFTKILTEYMLGHILSVFIQLPLLPLMSHHWCIRHLHGSDMVLLNMHWHQNLSALAASFAKQCFDLLNSQVMSSLLLSILYRISRWNMNRDKHWKMTKEPFTHSNWNSLSCIVSLYSMAWPPSPLLWIPK